MNKFRKLRNEELNRLSPESYKDIEKSPVVIVLDNIRSQNNIGSVFRTADAFRVEKIYLCGITATPPNREIHKTALGAEDSVEWEYEEDTLKLVQRLKADDYFIYAVEQAEDSISLEDFYLEESKKYAFIFGNEVKGVQQEVVDYAEGCIEIPQFGTKHSFNISVTAGMVMWQVFSPLLKIWKGEK